LKLAPGKVGRGRGERLMHQWRFTAIPLDRRCPSFAGDAVSDPVQPAGDGFGPANACSTPGQHQKCGLKRIFRIMLVRQDMPANAPDKPAVTMQQSGERFLSAAGDVVAE
jgi:hypothetical protein